MKSPFRRTSKSHISSDQPPRAEEPFADAPAERESRASTFDDFPPTERPSVEPFDARERWPLAARVALPWVVFNAVVVAGVLWTRPLDQTSTPPTSIAETTAPERSVGEVEGQVAADRGSAPPASGEVTSLGSETPAPEEQPEPLAIYPVLVAEGRLFALEGMAPEGESGSPAVEQTRRTTTLALPGGGALGITTRPHSSGELATGTWTVLSTSGTCLAERGRAVRLRLDSGEPGATPPPALEAHELDGCSVDHDTTDRAVAIAGAHPTARYEATDEGSAQLQSGGRAVNTSPDSCSGGVRIEASSGALLSNQPGVELAGRITLDGRELLVLEGAGTGTGLRVVDVSGQDVSLAAEAPYSPLWLGGGDC
jgi:hypothetical protein